MVAERTPPASRLSPPQERCPACHQERPHAELWRKGKRLVCCHACYWERRHQGRMRWEQANRARRTKQRRLGGVPCPVYEAWDVEALRRRGDGEPWTCVLYGPRGRAWPEATVLPAYGACSCGVAGCVHLVVACLAQQGGGSDG